MTNEEKAEIEKPKNQEEMRHLLSQKIIEAVDLCLSQSDAFIVKIDGPQDRTVVVDVYSDLGKLTKLRLKLQHENLDS